MRLQFFLGGAAQKNPSTLQQYCLTIALQNKKTSDKVWKIKLKVLIFAVLMSIYPGFRARNSKLK